MKILCWNIGGRLGAVALKQIDAVLSRAPDVLALQGVSKGNYPDWRDGLEGAGYSLLSAIDLVDVPYPEMAPPIRRKYFNLTAARHPIDALPGLSFEDPERAATAFPEQYLAACVRVTGVEPIEIHNAEVPAGEMLGVIKMHAFEAIRRRVDQSPDRPRILCGDFKAPHAEDDEGLEVWTAGHPRLREEWEAAERGVLEHPVLRDVYREQHEPGTPFAVSYLTRGTPHRYDHIQASPELESAGCRYVSDWLTQKLSDHAAVEAELAPRSA
ncbi:MAG: endonuclease/exonuclease/phosphatase family protein [Thermoleophilaceae bacterium]